MSKRAHARSSLPPVPDDFSRDFRALCDDQTTMPMHTTKLRLWCLLSTIQLASRHPSARQTMPIQIAMDMARHIEALIATTPALKRVAAQGWDQTLDLPWKDDHPG